MFSATIATKFDKRTYVPGERIGGTVSWESSEPLEEGELRLFYFTEGKGTQDVEIVDRMTMHEVFRSGSREFDFELPNGPFSFSGKLVSVSWALELVMKPGNRTERLEIILSPTGREIDLYAHDHAMVPEDAAKRWKRRFRVSTGRSV